MKRSRIFLAAVAAMLVTGAVFAQTSPLAQSAENMFRNHPNSGTKDAFVAQLDDLSFGSVANAVVVISNQPTDTDTLTIGADVYEFVNTGVDDDIANETNICVLIGGSAAATQANLLAAINSTDGDGLHATCDTALGAAAPANGTENVVGRSITTTIQIRGADSPGGRVTASNPSIVLAEAITHAADIWREGNVNLNTLGGSAPAPYGGAMQCKTITAAMITNSVRFSFPFTLTRFIVQARTATGVIRTALAALPADTYVINNGDVLATFGGGASPDVQATDVVCVVAYP